MRPIHENTVIQIDITNACHLNCANCTRFVGNHRKPYFMDCDTVERAIHSLDGFPGRIGIMGGEPTLHPRFLDILGLVRELIPDKSKREFWTAGYKWDQYHDEIMDTFDEDRIALNDHTQTTGRHQPLLVAISEVVKDPQAAAMLIDNCPFQARWSAAITPKGAFFCEIAAAQDWLFDGPGGYDIEPGWWKKTPIDFAGQVQEYCLKCSGALPMETYSDGRGGRDGPTRDVVSPGNLERLMAVGSRKAYEGNYTIFDQEITAEDIKAAIDNGWNPRQFRDFEANNPEDIANARQSSNDTG